MHIVDGRLVVAGRDAEALAREHGTPLYVYDLQRSAELARALQDALGRAGLLHRVRLALKALREPTLLRLLRRLAPPGNPMAVGVDACSPGEVLHALECGFLPEEVSYTGTNVSERDLDVIAPLAVHVNVDLLSQIDRFGRRCPARTVGLRLNPRAGVMRGHPESLYCNAGPTKFGICDEDLDEAMERAARHGLIIDTAHFHLANGMLDDELPAFDEALAAAERMVRRLVAAGCPLREVNVGGGLGRALHAGESPLDLDRYAGILARHFGDLGVAIGVEPGDFLANDAGLLLAEVVTVERRMETVFVGLDCGWNVLNSHHIYGCDLEFVVCNRADDHPAQHVHVVGNINEGDDVFGEDVSFPEVVEGDIVAMVSVGGYAQSMWTDHCGRPRARALFFEDRERSPYPRRLAAPCP